MEHKTTGRARRRAALAALGALALAACVDSDYDLTKDIDLTMTIGGDSLLLPTSDTDVITMDDVLDLEEGSSVVADSVGAYGLAAGDYYVSAKSGEEDDNSFEVEVDGLTVEGTRVNFDPQSLPAGRTVEVSYSAAIEDFDDDFSPTIREVHQAETQATTDISFTGEGITLRKGFTVTFPEYMTLSGLSGGGEAGKYTVAGNTVTLDEDRALPWTPRVDISAVDIDKAVADGLAHVEYGDKATGRDGHISLTGDIVVRGQASSALEQDMITATDIAVSDKDGMTMKRVLGVVDPDIDDPEIDPVTIDDLPDMLTDEETLLDWQNPQLYLTVTPRGGAADADTELRVEFPTITLRSTREGALVRDAKGKEIGELVIDEEARDRDVVVDVEAGGYTVCLSAQGAPTAGGEGWVLDESGRRLAVYDDVRVERLGGSGSPISRVPDKVEVTQVKARVVQEPCWLTLGRSYTLDISYQLVAPLSFGPDLDIVYRDTLDGWRGDLENIEAAHTLQARLEVVSAVPLDLELSATPLKAGGQEMGESEMTCTVTVDTESGLVARGTPEAPRTTSALIEMAAQGDGTAVQELDGLILTLRGSDTTGSGENINKNQTVSLQAVRVALLGGVTLNLN